MKQPDNNKKDQDPKIKEGQGDANSIHPESKGSNEKSYPKRAIKDTQFQNQPEFLGNEQPNKTEEE